MMHSSASPTRLRIEFAQESDPGRDPNKQINEDSCGYAETKFGHLCVLCDGMGGHYGGKEASRTAITTIFELIEQTPASVNPSVALKAAIEEAGRRVYRLGGPPENRTRPGSTVVAMVLHDRGVDVAHVGDSRAYVIRANQIYPLTRDHSMVQGMIDAGMLTEAQAIGHPDANKITRALGMKPDVEVEVRPEPMELYPGDVLLMSSDGLTDLVLSGDILGCTRQALASGPVEHACKMLVQLANHRGGHDNITVQMARVLEVGARSQTIAQGPPGTSSPTGSGEPPGASHPQEAVGLTKTDEPAMSQRGPTHPPHGYSPPAHGAPPPGPTATWGPVPPTATDAPPVVHPTAADALPAVRPTATGTPPAVHPTAADALPAVRPTASDPGIHPPPMAPGAPAGAMAFSQPAAFVPGAYHRHDAPPAPPLHAPPSSGYAATGARMAYESGPDPYAPASAPASTLIPGSRTRPSRGGIVFLIIGASAVIAVLLVVLLWSMLPR
jgi:PPM family protein phosphatase